ncbi:MAG: hypothetical protein UV43_C0041G0002 [Parcubacteria group bacterium GW2011_GWF2_42_7]|nr:MAG: hypothetical protein UU96_C0005G0002 [Parcubacteria group bacterium GW2011_GWC2_42_13]KKS57863.1 MAG: hypothetical protein UV22_C0011G0016 [Parcubacteria group bacterium GW2011_GWA2_42_35]KKS71286.1 MAG: hypothetical protein UV43_C0041G0002 [Parcubacteria group bacterium GW2011_GWF2_42_7]
MATNSTTTEDERAVRLQANRNQENQDLPDGSQEAEDAQPSGPNTQPRPHYINSAEAVFLVCFALAGDLAIFLTNVISPLLGSAAGAGVWLTFFLWLKFKIIKGAPKSWSRLLTMVGFLEIIPVINIFPTWVGFVILIIIADRIGRLPFFENFLQFPGLNRL